MLFLGLWDSVETILFGLIRKLIMWIMSFVYQLIAFLYNVFDYMTKVRILSGDNESLALDIYERIQVILAVVMVFYVTFEFVKYIVNPESFSDKEKGGGGLLKRILIVILLMAFTPQIFGMAYEFQNRIISSNVIPKVLIKDFDSSYYSENVGGQFSSDLLGLFYKPFKTSDGNVPVGRCSNDKTAEEVVNNNLNLLAQNGKMTNATTCIADKGKDVREGNETIVAPWLIDLGFGEGLIPLVVGGFMVWTLFSYCMEAGRVIIQFVFLQIIAPIPVLSYIAPGKDGMFNKWVKQCVTTYMDMFIRLFIIYLVMMFGQILVKIDMDSILNGISFPNDSLIPTFIKMFLLIGLMLFAMKAPKMVKELLPGGSNAASGDFGLGKDSLKKRLPSPVARAAGMARGALGRGANSVASRVGKRLASGVKSLNHARGVKKHGGVGYRDQLRHWGSERNRIRQEAKDAKKDAKDARKQAYKAEADAIRTRNSNVGRLVQAEAELNKALAERSRYELLRSKSNRTSAEENELLSLERTVNKRNANIDRLQNSVRNLENSIDVNNLSGDQKSLYNLYNATKAYESANATFNAMKPGDAGYAQAKDNLDAKAQALRDANNAYNSKTIESLSATSEKLTNVQKKINDTPQNVKDDYNNLTQLKAEYDQITDKTSAEATTLQERIAKSETYGENINKKKEYDDKIVQINKDLQDISSKNLTAARLEEKISEAQKNYKTAVDTYEQKKNDLLETPYGTVGTVVSGVGKTIAGTIGVAKDIVVGGAMGSKTTDITKIETDYKKNLASFVAERTAKEEKIANFGEPKITQVVTNFVQDKYNKFAKDHALPTTTYALNSEITERELEMKDVKSAATASQNVVSDLSSANKSAQEFIVNQKASQKVSASVDVMGRTFSINNQSLSDFRNSFVDETDRIKREASQKEQELANLQSQIYTLPEGERAEAHNRMAVLKTDISNLITDYQNRERALPDLDKKLGKIVERMLFNGELHGVTDASILGIPDNLRKIFEILRRDSKTMNLLSKNMDTNSYLELLNLDVENADFDTFDKLKDAIEYAGVNLKNYERDLSDQVGARKAAKERIELREKLNSAGSSGSSGGKK